MNKRLKELAEQAGLNWQFSPAYEKCLEHFAELIRQDEREACAQLCYELDNNYMNSGITGYGRPDGRDCADAIRQRGEQP